MLTHPPVNYSTDPLPTIVAKNRYLVASIVLVGLALALVLFFDHPIVVALLVFVGVLIPGTVIDRMHRRSSSLSELRRIDSLTGLPNRSGMQKLVDRASADGTPPTALFYVDLDHFHLVNDTVGHSQGDGLLVSVARVLESVIANNGTVGRIAGDAFVVALHCPPQDVFVHAGELVNAIRGQHFSVGGRAFRVTASIGVHLVGNDDLGFDERLAEADMARILAKRQGRDRFAVFDPLEVGQSDLRVLMRSASGILDRLANNELRLAVQRIEGLDGQEATCEILLRIDGAPDSSPANLIQAAESFGMITTIDQWVVTATVLAIDEGHLDHFAKVGINLSAVSINNDAFVASIIALFQKYPAAAQRVCLELTETALVIDPDKVSVTMSQMKQCGVTFAIDDFGSGSASFGLLRRLPFDTLKIDGQFVQRMNRDASDREVVKACVPIARLRNMTTVAEWVEDVDAVSMLRDFSVDYVQGFAVARPELLDLPLVLERATETTFEGIDIRDHGRADDPSSALYSR